MVLVLVWGAYLCLHNVLMLKLHIQHCCTLFATCQTNTKWWWWAEIQSLYI